MLSVTIDDFPVLGIDWLWETDPHVRLSSLVGRFRNSVGHCIEEALGQKFPGFPPCDPADSGAALAMSERRPFRGMIYGCPAEGATRWISFNGVPVFGPDGAFSGYRGSATDITAEHTRLLIERDHVEAGIAEQHRLFNTALCHMAHGLYMLDADGRVRVFNQQFLDLFGFSSEIVRTGMSVKELVLYSAELGNFPGMTPAEAWAESKARLASRVAYRIENPGPNGQTIAFSCTPTPDGGCVMVHEDVTEAKRADALIAEQHRTLNVALTNMSHGIMMLNPREIITAVNQQFLDLYGLASEIVKPGTTAEELIRYSAEMGNFPGLSADEAWSRARQRLHAGQHYRLEQELSNGRTIALAYTPMGADGWVLVHEDVTARKEAEARIARMATHDALTGIANRILFRERLSEALKKSERSTAVLCLDLDRFKAVNDTLGHATGDILLQQVTERLRATTAHLGSDKFLLARLGGDEFALVLTDAVPEGVAALAGALIEAIGRDYTLAGQHLNVGLSVGAAFAPEDGSDPERLLSAADMALYRAKAEGRGIFRQFDRAMDADLQARHALDRDLRVAIAEGQLELHYQPVLTLDTDRVTSFEALMRWRHPMRGLVQPSEFIPLAEETGLIVGLGEWALREACREAAGWPDGIGVSVNVSPVQFRSPALALTVVAALGESGLDPRRLELEITEGVLLQNGEATLSILHHLKELGVRIAMDDFGAGYSSLGYLRAFPFDKIKIDRSFVADVTSRTDAAAIVRAVTSLGACLGIVITAEGIERPEELERLRQEGCNEVQGYLIGRPCLPQNFVSAWMAERTAA